MSPRGMPPAVMRSRTGTMARAGSRRQEVRVIAAGQFGDAAARFPL